VLSLHISGFLLISVYFGQISHTAKKNHVPSKTFLQSARSLAHLWIPMVNGQLNQLWSLSAWSVFGLVRLFVQLFSIAQSYLLNYIRYQFVLPSIKKNALASYPSVSLTGISGPKVIENSIPDLKRLPKGNPDTLEWSNIFPNSLSSVFSYLKHEGSNTQLNLEHHTFLIMLNWIRNCSRVGN